MLRSIMLKTVREQRWAALGWGLGLGLLAVLTATGWAHAYPDEAARLLLAREIETSLSFGQAFYGAPHHIDQLGGFVAWRSLGLYPVLAGLFMVLAATSASRGAEERGELDVVLAASRGRTRLFAEQAGGLALALTAVCALIWTALLLCGPAAGADPLDPGRAALAMLNVGLAAALFGAFALLAAQFMLTRRAAAVAAGSLMFAAHIWNNLGLVATGLGRARWLSPLYLVSRSTPLADGHVDAVALALLALLATGLTALAGWLFVRRDLGAVTRIPVPGWIRETAAAGASRAGLPARAGSAWLLGSPLQRGLRAAFGTTLAWGVALGAYAALFAALAPVVLRAVEEQMAAQQYLDRLQRGDLATESGFLSFALFSLLPALVALFGVTLAASWAAEERAGRLEVELACPLPRRRYFIERVGAMLVTVAAVVLLTGVGFFTAAWLAGVDLAWGRALAAVLLIAPLAGVIVTFGYAVAAWRPGPVAAVVGPALIVSYFLDLLAPLFSLPDAVRELSVFHLYDSPLLDGVRWGGLAAQLILIIALTLAGSAAFARRDIAK